MHAHVYKIYIRLGRKGSILGFARVHLGFATEGQMKKTKQTTFFFFLKKKINFNLLHCPILTLLH